MGRLPAKKFLASLKFIEAVKNYSKQTKFPLWKIASLWGNIHPAVLSKAINQKILFESELPKIKDIAKHINYTGPIFEPMESAKN